jgi:hypothetical protein
MSHVLVIVYFRYTSTCVLLLNFVSLITAHYKVHSIEPYVIKIIIYFHKRHEFKVFTFGRLEIFSKYSDFLHQ